jgi:hypothetical protein
MIDAITAARIRIRLRSGSARRGALQRCRSRLARAAALRTATTDGLQGIVECMRVVRIDDSIFANGFD